MISKSMPHYVLLYSLNHFVRDCLLINIYTFMVKHHCCPEHLVKLLLMISNTVYVHVPCIFLLSTPKNAQSLFVVHTYASLSVYKIREAHAQTFLLLKYFCCMNISFVNITHHILNFKQVS